MTYCAGLMKSTNTDGSINYYISAATAGKLIATTPPSAMGSYITPVGVALTANTLIVRIGSPVGPHA